LAWPEREIYPSVRRSFVELRVDEWKGKILRFPAALNPVRRLTLLPEMYRSMTAIGRNAVWLDLAGRGGREWSPIADNSKSKMGMRICGLFAHSMMDPRHPKIRRGRHRLKGTRVVGLDGLIVAAGECAGCVTARTPLMICEIRKTRRESTLPRRERPIAQQRP